MPPSSSWQAACYTGPVPLLLSAASNKVTGSMVRNLIDHLIDRDCRVACAMVLAPRSATQHLRGFAGPFSHCYGSSARGTRVCRGVADKDIADSDQSFIVL
jgi:hypothetical protein